MGWGYHKRSRHDLERCAECLETEIDFEVDEYSVCGDCTKMLCADCSDTKCVVCEENDSELTEGPTCCEMCMESCEDCGDDGDDFEVFHRCCKAGHLAQCNAKSRAQRAASSAAQKVSDTETELKQARDELAGMQSRVSSLENQLKYVNEKKAEADKQLLDEEAKQSDSSTEEKKQAVATKKM